MMKNKYALHWVKYILIYLIKLPFLALRNWSLNRRISEEYRGISIIDFGYKSLIQREYEKQLIHIVKDALRLIESIDPRRFYRIQQVVRHIINMATPVYVVYDDFAKACSIDLDRYENLSFEEVYPDYEWYKVQIACAIIYGATQGYLRARRVPFTRSNLSRIDALCAKEQKRFVSKIRSENYDFVEDMEFTTEVSEIEALPDISWVQWFKHSLSRLALIWKHR